ncbi:MAG: hypothetical protein H6844_19275 [Alphaproteobacteria bacterium]|nr:hypothetical protein [Alphaproteobacteria bacterium]
MSDLSSSNDKITEEGKDWYQANREEIFSVIGNVNEEDKYDLAIIIANLVLNKYPFVIIGPLCAVCTLDILNELGPISEIPAQGDISGTVIELGKGNLRTILKVRLRAKDSLRQFQRCWMIVSYPCEKLRHSSEKARGPFKAQGMGQPQSMCK